MLNRKWRPPPEKAAARRGVAAPAEPDFVAVPTLLKAGGKSLSLDAGSAQGEKLPPGAFAEAARSLRLNHLCPIPLHPNRKPHINGFTEMRKPGLATLEAWAKRWPQAQVGIVTGRLSHVVVVDIDSADPAILRCVIRI